MDTSTAGGGLDLDPVAFEPVGTIDVKGRGLMQAWLLTGRRVQRVERLQRPEAPGWHPA